MRINPCDSVAIYGMRSNRQKSFDDVKKVTRRIYPLSNTTLEVYTAVNKYGEKVHKLYYLKDKLGNWIKSKLVYFTNNHRDKIVRSERS